MNRSRQTERGKDDCIMARFYVPNAANPAILSGKTIAIIGYGNQGRRYNSRSELAEHYPTCEAAAKPWQGTSAAAHCDSWDRGLKIGP